MPVALVTGSAGFIGMHLCRRLLSEGWQVYGIDSMSPRYDPALKARRLDQLTPHAAYHHRDGMIEAPGVLREMMEAARPDAVFHLAAEAGVRASIEDPRPYFEANLAGTFELLEAARAVPPGHLLLASTSSAYGANTEMPFVETMRADHPVSFYAATKKATETLAHAHSHIYGLPITMFRFFTVYGPWGRPDMAYFLFTDAILNGRPIKVFNHGQMRRDFVFVDDLVHSIRLLTDCVPPAKDGQRTTLQFASLKRVVVHVVVHLAGDPFFFRIPDGDVSIGADGYHALPWQHSIRPRGVRG